MHRIGLDVVYSCIISQANDSQVSEQKKLSSSVFRYLLLTSSASSHSIIPIDESDEAPTSTATGTEEHEPAPPSVPAARPLKHRSNHRSTPAFSSISENPSKNHELRTLGTSVFRVPSIDIHHRMILSFSDPSLVA